MTTTTNVEAEHVDVGQTLKETTINEGFNRFDDVEGSETRHDMASDANYTLDTTDPANEDKVRLVTIEDTGVLLTATRRIIFPANRRFYVLRNLTAQTLDFGVGGAGGAVSVPPNEITAAMSDGTDMLPAGVTSGGGGGTFIALSDTPGTFSGQGLKHLRVNTGATAVEFSLPTFLELNDSPASFTGHGEKLVRVNAGETALEFEIPPYDLGFFYSGKPTGSQEVFRMEAVRDFTILDGAPGSTGEARVASTGDVSFSVRKNGSQFGTVRFNISAAGTWAFDAASDEAFVAGDTLTVLAPASADSTLEDIAIFIKGQRDS